MFLLDRFFMVTEIRYWPLAQLFYQCLTKTFPVMFQVCPALVPDVA